MTDGDGVGASVVVAGKLVVVVVVEVDGRGAAVVDNGTEADGCGVAITAEAADALAVDGEAELDG